MKETTIKNLNTSKTIITGKLQKHQKGYGFVQVECDELGDVFIPASYMNHAMHGDRVCVELMHTGSGDSRKRDGRIVQILTHENDEVVGIFNKRNKAGYVFPDGPQNNDDIFIRPANWSNARNGEKVVVKITKWATGEQNAEGRIIERIGLPSDPATALKCLIRQYKLSENFPGKVMRETDLIPQTISEDELVRREDLRGKTIITIDGADAKDLDDAISVQRTASGNYLLGVHIADVSHYIKEGSALDKEALKRGCSVYLIDTVLPMLPKNISNGICSLNPYEDRLTLTCEMEIDAAGKVQSYRIFESLIRSKARMVYTDVSEILESKDQSLIEEYKEIYDDLLLMHELYQVLSGARSQRGSVDFDFDEAFITLNEDGIPLDVGVSERRCANQLIEEFMLKANEVIAEHHFWLDIPFVYRVHESPDPEKIDAFKKFISNFGFALKGSSDRTHPKALREIITAASGGPYEHIVSSVMLRSMRKAVYLPDCKGHFGLGLKYYCHFTSPIRRYPDLIIHRIIKESLKGAISDGRRTALKAKTEHASNISSDTERTAQNIERELEKMKKAEYMKNHIGEKFEGIISGVTSSGIFVELPNTIEGVIRYYDLHDDYYTFEKEKYRAVGDLSRKTYSLGDKVSVYVSAVDVAAREISFLFAC